LGVSKPQVVEQSVLIDVEPVAVGSVRVRPAVDKTFRGYDQDQPMLLAPDLRDWLPADHPARWSPTGTVTDTRNRQLRDLRISVTDRCNFRCVYCMPKEIFGRDFMFMERDELMTFEEMTRLARIAVAHGVEKIRLTGGEPLLRKGLEELVGMLAALKTPDGRDIDIALTTNGSSLAVMAQSLKDAGLKRVDRLARLAGRRKP
jgi:sulfatase maturation enzyme AslB (radical SAM superfamily)